MGVFDAPPSVFVGVNEFGFEAALEEMAAAAVAVTGSQPTAWPRLASGGFQDEVVMVRQEAGGVYRNRSLTDAQKESNWQKSKVRARIEHVFGFMSQTMKGFSLRNIGRRRNAAAIGFINLAQYE